MPLFSWTGNPWVDAGMGVIVAKAGKWKIEDLTKTDIETILSDGIWLANVNRQLKAFTMVVGVNSPLTNTSLNPSMKKENRGKLNPLNDTGFKQYCKMINELAKSVFAESGGKYRCEACGERPTTTVLAKYGKDVARDWFPLAGSIGSDAQSLPAASRTARICSFCLLAVQFLPLGAIIIGGKIACFQSTYPELTQLIVSEVLKETQDRLNLLKSDEKLSAVGQGKGSKEAVIMLLKIFSELHRNKRILALPPHASLNVWLFSNSGQDPDCDVIEIPNEALVFLWESAKTYRQEIEIILHRESKQIAHQLLECIKRRNEYSGFYPSKTSKSVSKGLFELYQTKVLGNSMLSLRLAEWLSFQIKSRLTAGDKNGNKLFAKLQKDNAYWNKDKTVIVKLNGMVAQLAEEGLLTLEEYTTLFPREEEAHHLSVRNDTYRWIWFYLTHDNLSEIKPEGGFNLFTHPLIKIFARDTFVYYQNEKGLKFIKKNILEAFKKGDVSTSDLQRWFISLGEIREGYTNETWDDLCRDENGNNLTYEVRFQFRLEIANLYRMAANKQIS